MAHLPSTGYRELLLLLLRRRRRLKVIGESMLPLLQPGDEITFDPLAYRKATPRIGELVVATHPYQHELTIVKRITAISSSGEYFLTGDNLKASTDSRHWGSIEAKNIMGKVTSYFR